VTIRGNEWRVILDGPATLMDIRRAMAAGRWPREKLQAHQERRLRWLLNHAYQNVPLYRALYDEAGFRPEQFRTLADLNRVPMLTKTRVRSVATEGCLARGTDPSRCYEVRTSGSTGAPLRILLSRHDDWWQRVTAWRILFEDGYRLTDRTLQIDSTPARQFAVQRLGVARKQWLSTGDSPETWMAALQQYRPHVLVATASVLHLLAENLLSKGIAAHSPRLVVSDDESLTPATRGLVSRVLGRDPVDVYGLCEVSNFAWQCEERDGHHLSADSHVVEVLAAPGETGPLVVTALGMTGMPFIRYETGDVAVAEDRPCKCGRNLPRLRQLFGRAVDSVMLPSGRRLLWPFFYHFFNRYTGLRRWRVLQDEPNRLCVEVVGMDGEVNALANALREALPEPMAVNAIPVSDIVLRPREKVRMVISRVGGSIAGAS